MARVYPYTLFIAEIDLSPTYLKETPNIFEQYRVGLNNSYILDNFRLEIEKFRTDKKIQMVDAERITLLQNFNNNIYDIYIRGYPSNIVEFCRLFIKYKNDIITIIQDINSFFLLLNKNVKRNENIYFTNPLVTYPNELIDWDFINNRITNRILGQDEFKIKIALNVFIYSTILNIKMPSIGLIDIHPDTNRGGILNPYNTYIRFINFILNSLIYEQDNISLNIPLKELNLGDILCDFLLNNIPIENLNNSNVFSNRFNNSTIRRNISDIINRIKINVNDVLMQKKKTKTNRVNEKYKVKSEYLIPYKIHIVEAGPNPPREIKIVYMKKSEIDKELDSLDKTFLHNQDLLREVLDDTVFLFLRNNRLNREQAIANLDKPNYKNVLACFMYILIRLVYTLSKNYIDQINNIIISMSQTRKGQFKGLNYKDALEYLTELDKSLFNFRNILLNNFYNMFLPSIITKMGYGMTTDINGCFVPEQGCVFLGDSNNILSNFPITSCYNMKTPIPPINFPERPRNNNTLYTIDNAKLLSFIVKIPDKYDIYDRNKILEIGGYIFNKDIMKVISKLLKEYYVHLKSIMEYNLFIFEKITNYFNVKKNIPINVVFDFIDLYNIMIHIDNTIPNTDVNYQRIDKEAFAKFEYNLYKSTEFYKKMYSIKIKIQQIKNADIRKLYNQQDMYLMCFNIFYRKAMVLYQITQNVLRNNKLKFELLKKFNERKKFYEDEINNFIKSF